jgi:hypothetical protein
VTASSSTLNTNSFSFAKPRAVTLVADVCRQAGCRQAGCMTSSQTVRLSPRDFVCRPTVCNANARSQAAVSTANNAIKALANFCVCARETAPVTKSFSGGQSGSRLGKVVPSTAEWRQKIGLCAIASGSPMNYGGCYPPTAYGGSPVYGAATSGPVFGHTSSHLEEVLLAETRSRLTAASPSY